MYRGLKSGSKDPAAHLVGRRPYDPTIQADQLQSFQDQRRQRGNMVSMHDALDLASQTVASQSRVQCTYTSFSVVSVVSADNPDTRFENKLLVPANKNRSSLYVINLSDDIIYMSFGPAFINDPLGIVFGFPLAQAGSAISKVLFREKNGVICTDDIYITNLNANTDVGIQAYEGVPSMGAA